MAYQMDTDFVVPESHSKITDLDPTAPETTIECDDMIFELDEIIADIEMKLDFHRASPREDKTWEPRARRVLSSAKARRNRCQSHKTTLNNATLVKRLHVIRVALQACRDDAEAAEDKGDLVISKSLFEALVLEINAT